MLNPRSQKGKKKPSAVAFYTSKSDQPWSLRSPLNSRLMTTALLAAFVLHTLLRCTPPPPMLCTPHALHSHTLHFTAVQVRGLQPWAAGSPTPSSKCLNKAVLFSGEQAARGHICMLCWLDALEPLFPGPADCSPLHSRVIRLGAWQGARGRSSGMVHCFCCLLNL